MYAIQLFPNDQNVQKCVQFPDCSVMIKMY